MLSFSCAAWAGAEGLWFQLAGGLLMTVTGVSFMQYCSTSCVFVYHLFGGVDQTLPVSLFLSSYCKRDFAHID